MHTEEFTEHTLKVGEKVLRGPTWSWGTQDKGMGMIIEVYSPVRALQSFTALVRWEDNNEYEYRVLSRIGSKTYHDLLRVITKNIIVF